MHPCTLGYGPVRIDPSRVLARSPFLSIQLGVLLFTLLSAKHKMAVTAATVLSWVTRKVLGEPKPVRLSTTSARVNVGEGCVGPPPPEDCKKGTPEQETCPEMPFKTPAAVSPRRASVPLLLNGMPPRFVFAALPCDRSRLQNTAPC